jgi:predicted transcriptional regulator
MPTAKQLQNAKKKLKMTPKPSGNKPKLPNRLTYIVIATDPKIKRDRELLKTVREYMKNSPYAK